MHCKEFRQIGPSRQACGPTNATPSFVTDSGSVMLHAALRGSGIARLPSFSANDALGAGDLRIVLPDWHAADLQIRSAYGRRPEKGDRPAQNFSYEGNGLSFVLRDLRARP